MAAQAAGFVLVGGESRRMGQEKALLDLGGQPLVVRTAERLRLVVVELSLVGSPQRFGDLGLPVLADRVTGRGPLAGIVTALEATRHDWNLIMACDLPYLETRFVEFLLEQSATRPEADAVVPRPADGWQPLCAAYHRRCLPAFERVLASEKPKISHAYDALRVHPITDEALTRFAFSAQMFKNMNTPEEYEEAKRVLGLRA